ncbi:MAG: tetraacyldisaccharide 4'-kinase [Pirellulales bacterium]
MAATIEAVDGAADSRAADDRWLVGIEVAAALWPTPGQLSADRSAARLASALPSVRRRSRNVAVLLVRLFPAGVGAAQRDPTRIGDSTAAIALRGLSLPYRTVMALRNWGFDRGIIRTTRVRIPVISIGNLSVGGTGKTPTVAWLAAWFREPGACRNPVVAATADSKRLE